MSTYRTAPAAALLGAVLVRAGTITQEQLEEALAAQVDARRRLGEILVERGWLTERALAEALAEQFGLEFVDLSEMEVGPSSAPALPDDIARAYGALSLGHDDTGRVIVAVADPADAAGVSAIRAATDGRARLVVAEKELLAQAVARVIASTEPSEAG